MLMLASTALLLTSCGVRPATAAASAVAATSAPSPSSAPTYNGCHCYTGPPLGTPDATCDSPTQQLTFVNPPDNKLPHTVLGEGPVYWGGQDVWNVAGTEGVVVVDSRVHVPVVVTFEGPATGDTGTLGGQARITVAPRSDGNWAYADGMFMPSAPGCWTMNAVYAGTTVRARFTVVTGPTEPA